ncbi:MAG: NAD(P)-binding domain-containing protein [Bilophila sp.]
MHLFGYNRTPKRLEPLIAKGVKPVPDIPGLVAASDIVIIGVKPYLVAETLQAALPALRPESVVISIAAGVTLRDLREAVQNRCHVVRVMPNTPALVGAGVFAIEEDPQLPQPVLGMVLDLFSLIWPAHRAAGKEIQPLHGPCRLRTGLRLPFHGRAG